MDDGLDETVQFDLIGPGEAPDFDVIAGYYVNLATGQKDGTLAHGAPIKLQIRNLKENQVVDVMGNDEDPKPTSVCAKLICHSFDM